MNLLLIREQFFKDTTIGKLYINGEFFCHTLEDAIRGYGIKVYGHTGIPAGAYKIDLSVSHRFKRLMPMVYTEAKQISRLKLEVLNLRVLEYTKEIIIYILMAVF